MTSPDPFDKPIRIIVSCPMFGGKADDIFTTSWTKTLNWAQQRKIGLSLQTITNESLLPRARNMSVKKGLDALGIFTHLLFIDADMGWEPYRLERLIAIDKDLAGCPGPAKHIHWEKVYEAILNGENPEVCSLRYAVNFLDKGGFQATNGFAKVRDFGLCFTLVKLEALRRMADYYPEQAANNMVFCNGQEQTGNLFALFDTAVCMEDDRRYLECDHAFLYRWRKMGGDVWADMTGDLHHAGLHHFKGSMAEYFFKTPFNARTLLETHTHVGKLPPLEHVQRVTEAKPDRIHLSITRPNPDIIFPLNFVPFAKVLQRVLQDMGYECTRRENYIDEEATNIVFSWHDWNGPKGHPVEIVRNNSIIIYQGEQLAAGGRMLPDFYYQSMQECDAVWDYSQDNIEVLNVNGVSRTHWVPPGWHASIEGTIDRTGPKPIDVLFFGTMNPRRNFVMQQLAGLCNVRVAGWESHMALEELIGSAKLVLNIHFYLARVLELHRLVPLLANGVPIVTEISAYNPYEDGVLMCHYKDLLAACVKLLTNPEEQEVLGQRGLAKLREMPLLDYVQRALSGDPQKPGQPESDLVQPSLAAVAAAGASDPAGDTMLGDTESTE
jgi:hypothetical protein